VIEKLTLYQKIYDLYLYTHQFIRKFPKSERFLISLGLQNTLLEAIRLTVKANVKRDLKERRCLQDEIEACLEMYATNLRLSHDLNFLSGHKYGVASKHLAEIFRILYGWKIPKTREQKT